MAIPNYTYLKLKMPEPKGVITVSSSYERAYECDVECVEYGEAVENSTKLASKLEALAAEAPEPKRHAGSFVLTLLNATTGYRRRRQKCPGRVTLFTIG